MEKQDQESLNDVLSAIRNMVREETRAKFSDTAEPQVLGGKNKPKAVEPKTSQRNLPAKILVLHPHMRVKVSKPDVFILDKNARVPHDTPIPSNDSFAVANPAMDEGLLREIVREVVQEQLRGELGKEIVNTVKRDMAQLLENKR